MAQFDIYENPNLQTKNLFPYLIELQNDLLGGLHTTMVAPLAMKSSIRTPLTHLNPHIEMNEHSLIMLTQEMAGVLRKSLGKHVASAAGQREDIIHAIDFLFTGI